MNTETVVAPTFHRKNPFPATLLRSWPLTRPGSAKDTRHCEFTLAGSDLVYTVGDSLGVFANNPPSLVQELHSLLKLDMAEEVPVPGGSKASLETALLRHYTLNRASRKILHGVLERLPQGESESRDRLQNLLSNDAATAEYLDTRDYVDILLEFPEAKFESGEAWVKMLSPIQPRLYSIASSPVTHPGEVHLCVGVVRYETHNRRKAGLASGYLADLITPGVSRVPVFVQESAKFRLPQDTSRDIIMVGPGTGIAPFRAFLEHRIAQGATGRNWLFFGEQHQATDFLYEDDLTLWKKSGALSRLDLAFSRDQTEKIYVQHRMLEHAADLWNWIQGGAYFYVCGDARRMAKDVHAALIQIAEQQGGMARDAATHYIDAVLMKEQRRYLRDVY